MDLFVDRNIIFVSENTAVRRNVPFPFFRLATSLTFIPQRNELNFIGCFKLYLYMHQLHPWINFSHTILRKEFFFYFIQFDKFLIVKKKNQKWQNWQLIWIFVQVEGGGEGGKSNMLM